MAKNTSWKNVLVLVLMFLIGFGTGSISMFKVISNKLPDKSFEMKLWK